MPSKGRTGAISEVRRSKGELCLIWRIAGFLDLTGEGRDFYGSPRFSFADACWFMAVYPNRKNSGRVCLRIHRDDTDTSTRTVNISVGVRGSKGVIEKRIEVGEQEFTNNDAWLLYGLGSRSELSEQKQRLMPDDHLTITCDMKIPGSTDRDTEKLSEDFGKLLVSGDKSDVLVQVCGVEFQVHSHVLFARCPALSVSLQHMSAESASNRIIVEDCKPDTFRDFLHFLYTGSVQSLTKDNVFRLYQMADRYLVNNLKQLCVEHMQDALSVDTFCDAVRLAMMHTENGLMDRAIAFAAQNIQSILSSEDWRNFNLKSPNEANEVLLKFVVPPSKRQKSSRFKKNKPLFFTNTGCLQ